MKFDRRIFSNLILFVLLIVVTVMLTMCQTTSAVKVAFGDELMGISATGYGMNISYEDVEALELTEGADLGSPTDGKKGVPVYTGLWKNDTWGEYYICYNSTSPSYIVVHLVDGRTCVFNCNTDEKTAEIYQEFLTYLPEEAAE